MSHSTPAPHIIPHFPRSKQKISTGYNYDAKPPLREVVMRDYIIATVMIVAAKATMHTVFRSRFMCCTYNHTHLLQLWLYASNINVKFNKFWETPPARGVSIYVANTHNRYPRFCIVPEYQNAKAKAPKYFRFLLIYSSLRFLRVSFGSFVGRRSWSVGSKESLHRASRLGCTCG